MLEKLHSYWSLRVAARNYLRTYGLLLTIRAAFSYVFDGKTISTIKGKTTELFEGVEVLWVSPDPTNSSHLYRVTNPLMATNLIGIHAIQISLNDFLTLESLPTSVKGIVFWRSNIDLSKSKLLSVIKDRNVKIIYDTDDYTFDREVYNSSKVAGLREVSPKHAQKLSEFISKEQANQIMQSDYFFGSTERLVRAATKMGKASFLVPNIVNDANFSNKKAPLSSKSISRKENLRLVYASGSNTHRQDFKEAQEGIFKFLEQRKFATLTFLGHAPISRKEIPKSIRDQVFFTPPVPKENYLRELATFDVNLAPLEVKSEFVQAKSALKYMQAAYVGIPTLASPTLEYANVITHGVNGWLCQGEGEWFEVLCAVAGDEDLRIKTGEAALQDVLSNHSLSSLAQVLKEVWPQILNSNHVPRKSIPDAWPKKITWIIPDLPSGSGGHRNVLRFAHYLPNNLFESTVLVLDSVATDAELNDFVSKHYGMNKFRITSNRDSAKNAHGLFATHHSTVDAVRALAGIDQKKFYLVQDFEAFFYPMSENHIHAIRTLEDKDFKIICSGPWMANKVLQTTGRQVSFFEFPVDETTYFPNLSEDITNKSGVIFFAKNDTPRRLFNLGISALRKISNINPDLEIRLFGGSRDNLKLFKSEFTVLGKLPSIADLADLYRQSLLGIVFSTTNPSLVPYEMLACGLPVIDVNVPLDNYNPFGEPSAVIRTQPTARDISMTALRLIEDVEFRKKQSDLGLQFISKMPSEQMVAREMAEFLLGAFSPK